MYTWLITCLGPAPTTVGAGQTGYLILTFHSSVIYAFDSLVFLNTGSCALTQPFLKTYRRWAVGL